MLLILQKMLFSDRIVEKTFPERGPTMKKSYQKKGYLVQDFKVFRLKDPTLREIPFHYHDFHKLLLFLSGSADYIIEGKTYPLQPRDIVFVSAGEIHRPVLRSKEPYERIIIYIAPDFLSRHSRSGEDLSSCFRLAQKNSSVMHVPKGTSHDLLYHMDKLEKAAHEQGFAQGLYTELLFLEFMILLHRALYKKEMLTTHEAHYDEKIQQLLHFIQEHLSEDLSIDRLAAETYLSKYYLMRRFKAETGYSLHQYINSKRLLLARSLLEGRAPVTEICYECGFQDFSTFSRAFRHRFHLTPTEYRKQVDSAE